jgi:hypothetical protein
MPALALMYKVAIKGKSVADLAKSFAWMQQCCSSSSIAPMPLHAVRSKTRWASPGHAP